LILPALGFVICPVKSYGSGVAQTQKVLAQTLIIGGFPIPWRKVLEVGTAELKQMSSVFHFDHLLCPRVIAGIEERQF
jgi:hypothetical protein